MDRHIGGVFLRFIGCEGKVGDVSGRQLRGFEAEDVCYLDLRADCGLRDASDCYWDQCILRRAILLSGGGIRQAMSRCMRHQDITTRALQSTDDSSCSIGVV